MTNNLETNILNLRFSFNCDVSDLLDFLKITTGLLNYHEPIYPYWMDSEISQILRTVFVLAISKPLNFTTWVGLTAVGLEDVVGLLVVV